jgi:hypothetical protein
MPLRRRGVARKRAGSVVDVAGVRVVCPGVRIRFLLP